MAEQVGFCCFERKKKKGKTKTKTKQNKTKEGENFRTARSCHFRLTSFGQVFNFFSDNRQFRGILKIK